MNEREAPRAAVGPAARALGFDDPIRSEGAGGGGVYIPFTSPAAASA